ncbi:hypothetical protein J6590_091640 [Homalodisca vitripennis]|nr:hypothetical protein J6590_018808 [Homalodisca vitripennis]KAG8293392.1 hypothetical protein J6590_018810 [Homalodisca vitripennis]KAG8324467.1 hypothetical protein J6590_091640 [Homalodisca vitripennis]
MRSSRLAGGAVSLVLAIEELEEQVAVLVANQSQPTTRSTRPPHCTGRTIIGDATCLDSSPTTSLCDGYLGTHTGRRTPSTTSPLGLHITAST